MTWLFLLAVIFGLFYAATRYDFSFRMWSGIITATLLVLTFTGFYPTAFIFLLWAVFLPIAIILNVDTLRKQILSGPILKSIRKKLPPMSDTEREAIEAGTVWWEAELFKGNPDFTKLHAYPKPALSTEEQAFVDGPTEKLCQMIDDWHITHELNRLPEEVWEFMKREKFLGMIIPEEFGGLGFSAQAHSEVVLKLASKSVTGAVTVMVPNSLGPAELLLHYGTEEQKNYYLPRLAVGDEIPCFALTGPKAGSDAGAMPDFGVVCKGQYKGKEVLGFRLNWEKRYITLGPVATLLGLAFKAYDPDQLIGEKEELGITCALIPTDIPGLTIGNRHYPLDSAFQNGPNSGKDVFIPMEMIIGGQERIGQGWRMLMESLSAGRGISLPALGTAGGKQCSRMTGAYARVRKQFHLPIGKFEGVEEALARMGGFAYLMDASRQLTAVGLDMGERPSVVSAILKYNLTEMMRIALNDAMDIHGGRGICMGPGNYLARHYQAIPIAITVEGANILTRSLIIFGQGAMRCHPYLLSELEAAHQSDPEKSLHDFDAALFKHLGYTTRNAIRSFLYALSGSLLAPNPGHFARPDYYRHLSRLSASFSMLSDMALLVLGGGLKRKEKLSGRFADGLSHLYLASAALKRFEDQERPQADQPLLEWSMHYCFAEIQQAMDGIIQHFPLKPMRWMLRLLIFPYGRRFRVPKDKISHEIAKLLLQPSEARDRLTKGIYQSIDPDDPYGRVEFALHKTLEAEPIEKRLHESGHTLHYSETYADWVARLLEAGYINSDQATLLKTAEEAVADAIRVDDFPQDNKTKMNVATHEAA
ncbi:MAG TPA: acyl-CoA dehydrogenase [Chromatiales bacterium]|nr:acyl-CoA dehydrogenase [Thiotrichales bacterium]HIP67634.1 acyl-CoA dehydrogenase [Chromatiales bacterium]